MIKLLSIPLVVLLYTCSHAQVQWFQPGDEWTYDVFKGWSPDVNGLNRLKVDKEVIILGEKLTRLLRHNPMNSGSANEILLVRQEGEKVFLQNGGPGSSIPLYDFSLIPGDTLFFLQVLNVRIMSFWIRAGSFWSGKNAELRRYSTQA